jgi:SAM-dependent methyltransferase
MRFRSPSAVAGRPIRCKSGALIQSSGIDAGSQNVEQSDGAQLVMDHSAHSASVFDKLADKYREKYMDLTVYDEFYREFCNLLPTGRVRVLDAACGPGNVSRYLVGQRPDLEILGIDLAPRMVELAREAVPLAQFAVQDCRKLADLNRRFEGILCAFGLPYLLPAEAEAFIQACANILEPGGVLYLSTMLGRSEGQQFERRGTGDQLYVSYHSEQQVMSSLQSSGFEIVQQKRVPSPSTAPVATIDFIVMAVKG